MDYFFTHLHNDEKGTIVLGGSPTLPGAKSIAVDKAKRMSIRLPLRWDDLVGRPAYDPYNRYFTITEKEL